MSNPKFKIQNSKFFSLCSLWFSLLLYLLIFLTFSIPSFSAPSSLQLGKTAPNFTLKTEDGQKISLSDFKNRSVVIISFWMPEFPPSMEEIEKLQKQLERKKNDDVKIITITQGKTEKQKEASHNAFEYRKIRFPILYDEASSVTKGYEIVTLPAFYIVDRRGKLASALLTDVTEKIRNLTFMEILDRIINEKTVDAIEFQPKMEDMPFRAMLGKLLPDFKSQDQKGNLQAPIYYRGFRKLIIVFWQPWCPHCQKELPRLQHLYDKYREKYNFEILAVSGAADKKNQELMKKIIEERNITFPVVTDDKKEIFPKYQVEKIPIFFIADLDGNIREIFSGEISLLEDTLLSIMENLDRNSEKGK